MSGKTVAEKARIRSGATVAVVNPVAGIVEALGMRPFGLVSVDAEWSAFRVKRAT